MRRFVSIAGAALLAVTAFATPVSADAGKAGGSCGTSAGEYGLDDVNSTAYGYNSHGVTGLYYQVNYSGVPAPTTVGVIIRRNGELEDQVAVHSFTAEESGGTYANALRANISPDAQGFANSLNGARFGRQDGSGSGRRTQNSGTQAGIAPADYTFVVTTGSRGDVYNVKDGTVARNAFIADEAGYLGTFSCGVSTDQGSGPG